MTKLNINFIEYDNIGYHGHTSDRINEVINTGTFISSNGDNEWLGTGVYFFENDISQAIDWCTRARNYKDWSIIKARIKSSKLLDLDDAETFKSFYAWSKVVYNKYNKIENKRKITEKVLFNLAFKIEPYEVVRKTFEVPKGQRIYGTNIIRTQIQLCVRSDKCIINFKEVDRDGCEKIL